MYPISNQLSPQWSVPLGSSPPELRVWNVRRVSTNTKLGKPSVWRVLTAKQLLDLDLIQSISAEVSSNNYRDQSQQSTPSFPVSLSTIFQFNP